MGCVKLEGQSQERETIEIQQKYTAKVAMAESSGEPLTVTQAIGG